MAAIPKDAATLIVALKNNRPMPKSEKKADPLSMLLGKDDAEPDDLAKRGIESALRRMFEAADKGDWSEAASASDDLHELQCSACDPRHDDDETVYDDDPHSMPPLDDEQS